MRDKIFIDFILSFLLWKDLFFMKGWAVSGFFKVLVFLIVVTGTAYIITDVRVRLSTKRGDYYRK